MIINQSTTQYIDAQQTTTKTDTIEQSSRSEHSSTIASTIDLQETQILDIDNNNEMSYANMRTYLIIAIIIIFLLVIILIITCMYTIKQKTKLSLLEQLIQTKHKSILVFVINRTKFTLKFYLLKGFQNH